MIHSPTILAERLTNEDMVMQTHFCQSVPCCVWQLVSSGELVDKDAVFRLYAEGRLTQAGERLGCVDGATQTWRLVR
jgi:hypothetical protein